MAIFFFFTIVDAKNQSSTVEIPFPDSTPLVGLSAGVQAIAALINPLVTGGLRSAGVKIEVDVPTFGPVAQLLSDVQEKAEFGMRTLNGFLKILNLPTFDETFFVTNSDQVNRTDPAVIAWVDFLEDGITAGGTLFQPSDQRSEDLVLVESAVENWGRRRR